MSDIYNGSGLKEFGKLHEMVRIGGVFENGNDAQRAMDHYRTLYPSAGYGTSLRKVDSALNPGMVFVEGYRYGSSD